MSQASVPISLRSCLHSQFSWILRQDPILLGQASEPKGDGSCIKSQGSWVLRQDPFCLGTASGPNLCYKYCYFIIIKSINIKNFIIFIINIIFFIIIDIIYKIINKFEKKNIINIKK
jgi:hypothetical protein